MKKLFLALILSLSAAAASAANVVIDVRTPEEFAAGHIAGAVNIDYTQISQRISQSGASKDDAVILYCHSGRRAGIALNTLRAMGYKNVSNYGGMSQAQEKLCRAGTAHRQGC